MLGMLIMFLGLCVLASLWLAWESKRYLASTLQLFQGSM